MITVPINKDTLPINNHKSSIIIYILPTDNETSPMNNDTAAIDNETSPIDKDTFFTSQ